VTENGFGKRTRVEEYPAKGRGTMGVLTVRYTEARGRLAGAMIVKDGYDLMLISHDGTVIRTAAEGISRMGRATQGVRVMNLRDGDSVSAIARVTEPQGAAVDDSGEPVEPAPGDELPDESAGEQPETEA
jgi:DNA gyrase subunit A